jgi:hypothetical protein
VVDYRFRPLMLIPRTKRIAQLKTALRPVVAIEYG